MAEAAAAMTATICELRHRDWERLDALFQKVFRHRLDSQLADYRYAPGSGDSIGLVGADGCVIAHCGITYRNWMAAGKLVAGAQLGDLMVAPEARDVLARKKLPFYRVMEGALKRLVSRESNPWVYGFPSDRAMRVGERLGLFDEVDQIHEITWGVSSIPLRASERHKWSSRLAGAISLLWRSMAKDLRQTLVGVRDAAYFKRRYFDHPVHHYRAFVIQSWIGRVQAVFVLRSHGDRVELMDWVAPVAAAGEVIEQARRAAAQLGGKELFVWTGRAYVQTLSPDSASIQPLQFKIPACGLDGSQRPWVQEFRDRLWVTSGDTDYR